MIVAAQEREGGRNREKNEERNGERNGVRNGERKRERNGEKDGEWIEALADFAVSFYLTPKKEMG